MNRIPRIALPALFGVVVLCFLLPFVEMQQNGRPVASASGMDLVLGNTPAPQGAGVNEPPAALLQEPPATQHDGESAVERARRFLKEQQNAPPAVVPPPPAAHDAAKPNTWAIVAMLCAVAGLALFARIPKATLVAGALAVIGILALLQLPSSLIEPAALPFLGLMGITLVVAPAYWVAIGGFGAVIAAVVIGAVLERNARQRTTVAHVPGTPRAPVAPQPPPVVNTPRAVPVSEPKPMAPAEPPRPVAEETPVPQPPPVVEARMNAPRAVPVPEPKPVTTEPPRPVVEETPVPPPPPVVEAESAVVTPQEEAPPSIAPPPEEATPPDPVPVAEVAPPPPAPPPPQEPAPPPEQPQRPEPLPPPTRQQPPTMEQQQPTQQPAPQFNANVLTGFAAPYINLIDSGALYRKPFKILYTVFAVLNLLSILGVLGFMFKGGVGPIVIGLFMIFALWIGFQIWWNRREKVNSFVNPGSEFVALPVFSHLIQTIGEWAGTFIAITGVGASLGGLIASSGSSGYGRGYGMDPMEMLGGMGAVGIIVAPILGFLILIITRAIAEQIRALARVADNTRNIDNNTKRG